MAKSKLKARLTRRLTAAAAALMAILGSVGCGAQPQDCARLDVQCAGLVTDFGSVGEGISHEAWLALEDARSAGLLDRVDYIETVDTRDRQANIDSLAANGYDIIISAGVGMTEETLAAAGDFPAIYFIGVQQSPALELLPGNYAALVFHEEQMGFLAGAAAGLLTQSGRAAAVCEVEFIDAVRLACDGFRLGAEYVDPAIEVEVSFRSGPEELLFRDHEWGTETASLSIERGADVVFAIGEDTANAALKAAAKRGAMVIGAETDQYRELPELGAALVTSSVLDVRGGLLALLKETVEGQFRAGLHWGEVGLAPFHDFAGRMPARVQGRLVEITDDIRLGVIHLDAVQ